MIIPLVPALLTGSSDLPGNLGRAVLSSAYARLRELWRDSVPLFGLAPCGVLPAICLTADAVRSYRTFSPLPASSRLTTPGALGGSGAARDRTAPLRMVNRNDAGGIFSVPLVLQVTLTGGYPAHCPSEFGLSSCLRPFRLRQAIIWPTAASYCTSPVIRGLRLGIGQKFSTPVAQGTARDSERRPSASELR
jgi:hypothetical protein